MMASLPSPLRRAAVACTAVDKPRMIEMHMKFAKPAIPTAAKAFAPNDPTMAVSTKFMMFCEVMPPIIGSAKVRIVRRRSGDMSYLMVSV